MPHVLYASDVALIIKLMVEVSPGFALPEGCKC